jgi:hypothetical protein
MSQTVSKKNKMGLYPLSKEHQDGRHLGILSLLPFFFKDGENVRHSIALCLRLQFSSFITSYATNMGVKQTVASRNTESPLHPTITCQKLLCLTCRKSTGLYLCMKCLLFEFSQSENCSYLENILTLPGIDLSLTKFLC